MKPTRSAGTPNPGRRSAIRAESASGAASDANSAAGGEPSPGSFQPQRPLHDDVARRAYQRWEEGGREHGRDQDHWYDAERELRGPGESSPPGEETRRSEP